MPSIETSIEIAAEPARVWALLSDLAGYPGWNSSIVHIKGSLAEGERLRLRARLPGGMVMALSPVLSRLRNAQELSWRAWLLHPRLFSADHRFILERVATGARLSQREDFHGWFSPLFTFLFARGLRRSYAEANLRLKQLAEQQPIPARAAAGPSQ